MLGNNAGKAKHRRKQEKNSSGIKDRTFTHMNGNQLVAVGYTWYPTGETKELCLLPVNIHLEPIMVPMVTRIRSDTVILDEGIDREIVQDAVSDWFNTMRLPYGKKMILLVWNAVRFHKDFNELVDTEFEYIVHEYKCLQQIAHFANDLAIDRGEPAPYPKDNLLSSASRAMGDEYMEECKNDAAYRALITGKLYKKILTEKRTMWT